MLLIYQFLFFFFQAEDGIRDRNVTGVQTCALPIWFCSCPLDSLDNGLDSIFGTVQGRSKTAFVTHGRAQSAFMQHLFEVMEHFRPHPKTFPERRGPYGTYHEFLECNGRIRMRPAVDDVHHG